MDYKNGALWIIKAAFRREGVMRIIAMSQQECGELLRRVPIGRLACSLDNQPYVVPVAFSYEPDCIYVFSTLGQKIEWMRQNPKVCLQVDEIGDRSNWFSVIVTGTYLELREPQYTAQKEHARELLGQRTEWWLDPLAERRMQSSDLAIKPVFFRLDTLSTTGLRAAPEAE
jgi:nitroimidazol reductase NimA-like FMN-containing flavoprotein (pyridoxamine 5'-phosphate oxidase superfamily)